MAARRLEQRRMLITGASSGIGRATAILAAEAGAKLVLTGRNLDGLEVVAAECLQRFNNRVHLVTADVTDDGDRKRLVATAVDTLGGLDDLVNVAGVASFGHFRTSSEEVLRKIMETNFFAPAELIRLAIPHLSRGTSPTVTTVASMCGRRGVPAWPEYSASKFALVGLIEALRGEMARFDIDVLLVLPGLTRTGLNSNLLHNTGRMKIDFSKAMDPETVGKTVLDSIRRNRTEVVVGWEARWILWINKWMPRLVDRLMARRVKQLYAQEAAPAVTQDTLVGSGK